MATEKTLTSLVINKIDSQETYNKMKAQGLINEDELYLTPENSAGGSSYTLPMASASKLGGVKAPSLEELGAVSMPSLPVGIDSNGNLFAFGNIISLEIYGQGDLTDTTALDSFTITQFAINNEVNQTFSSMNFLSPGWVLSGRFLFYGREVSIQLSRLSTGGYQVITAPFYDESQLKYIQVVMTFDTNAGVDSHPTAIAFYSCFLTNANATTV